MAEGAPALSVILPCYNGEKTLDACLQSILVQEFWDFEVILFDDGSTDGTLVKAKAYKETDPRIRIIPSDHVGLVPALQRACNEARAPFLARMDADDVAHPSRFRLQMAYMDSHPRTALCGTQIRYIGEGRGPGFDRYERWINSVVSPEDMVCNLFIECPIPHPTFLMRKAKYEEVGGYRDAGWPEDYDLVMRFHLAGAELGKVERSLLDWRHWDGRLSMKEDRYGEDRFRQLKMHYLFKTHLRDQRPFYQWGAGEVGKQWLKTWEEGRPLAVVDINPRKVGREIHGCKVIEPNGLPTPKESFTVVAVGAPGARGEIRDWFVSRGYEEIQDFVFVA